MPGAITRISASASPVRRWPSPPTATIKDGYTVGAGLEYMFAPNWSAKVEYQYYNFGSTTFTGGPADDRRRPLPGRRAHRQGRHQLSLRLGWPGRRPLLSASFALMRKRAGGFRRPFCLPGVAARPLPAVSLRSDRPAPTALDAKNSCCHRNFVGASVIVLFAGWWTTNMRAFVLGLIFSAVRPAVPCPNHPEIRASGRWRPMRSPSCRTPRVRPGRSSRSPAPSGGCTAGKPA